MERARQSDTWTLASPEARPWLLMMWATAWEQTPCGSLPADDELIAARLGMPTKLFAKHRAILLRKWWLAEDGRYYHDVLVQRVTEMMERRRKESDRKALARAKRDAEAHQIPAPDPHLSRGTTTGIPRDSTPGATPEPEPEPEEIQNQEAPTVLVNADGVAPYRVPPCDHKGIVNAYATALPRLPQVAVLTETRKSHMQARWREVCGAEKLTAAEALDYFAKFFAYVGESSFLTGAGPPRKDTGKVWRADLEWLMQPGKFAKVIEGAYHDKRQQA